MSIPVVLRDLDAVVCERGSAAYVVTVSERGTPHVVHAQIIRRRSLLVAMVGAHTADNARRRPHVSVLYPVREPADYSLIIDAVATVDVTEDGPRLLLAPTRAVLHRPGAPDPTTSPCGSDCLPVALGRASGDTLPPWRD